ncbi:hypothetical protein C9J85_02225 [Haloferax sp. wsp5]|nr:hypothetical protein C9J85_02225 [Haloferax sp. wsp5]
MSGSSYVSSAVRAGEFTALLTEVDSMVRPVHAGDFEQRPRHVAVLDDVAIVTVATRQSANDERVAGRSVPVAAVREQSPFAKSSPGPLTPRRQCRRDRASARERRAARPSVCVRARFSERGSP